MEEFTTCYSYNVVFFDLPLYLLHKLLLSNQRFVDFLFIICCLAVAPKLIIPSGKLNNNRFRSILFTFYLLFYIFLFLKTIIKQKHIIPV